MYDAENVEFKFSRLRRHLNNSDKSNENNISIKLIMNLRDKVSKSFPDILLK